jgi:hypothetical protein
MAARRLSASASVLRYSLLASLGLLGAACGGSSTSDGQPRPRTVGQCSSPTIDPKTQLPVCEEGFSHRPVPVRCQPTTSSTAEAPAPGGGVAPPESQLCDGADCSMLKYGYCDSGEFAATCRSGCVEDSDCPDGSVCSCTSGSSPTGGECVASECKTDADCGDALCASVREPCGSSRFACLREADECLSDSDCQSGLCTIEDGHRACFQGACGRPFLVLAEPRLPSVVGRRDWLESATPRVDHLGFDERSELAAHWTRLGQMEHASIAAFARFSLQLLSLGAPAELVEQCTRALADETDHTKLCFGIASAYAGRAVGPGPLDLSGALETTSLVDVVDLVIAEGCFGETSAALEALDAAETASDPVIVSAYLRIASDEQRHAELAFRFVRWALEHGGAAVTKRIEVALQSDLAKTHAARSVAMPCLAALVKFSHAA